MYNVCISEANRCIPKNEKTGIILTNFNRSECTDNTTNQNNKIYTFPLTSS